MLRQTPLRFVCILAALTLVLVPLLFLRSIKAEQLSSRSIIIGSSKSSVVTVNDFRFNIQTAALVGSMVFEYCTNTPFFSTPCTAPNGLDVSTAALDSQAGDTGYVIDGSTTTNKLVLTRVPVISNTGPAQYVFSNITNPSETGTVFVRISLHGSTDGTGPDTDRGAMAFSIIETLSTQAYVPPILVFCVGVTLALDCSSSSGSFIDLGELEPTKTSTGTSQYSGATNDIAGYTVTVFGTTLTSGNKAIPALASPSFSLAGSSQFGINLRSNTNPNVGQDPSGPGSAAPTPNYNLANNFKFASGETISASSTPTLFNLFTVSYVVNVGPSQPPGIYSATFTYVAVATF